MIEKIKISELTPTNTKGLVIVTVYEGGVPKTYSYDLNNITGVVKGSEFAGFVPCSQYIGAYIKPFTSQGGIFDTTDQFFYILTGYGSAGFWDDNDQPQVFSQLNTQTTIVYWDGSQYNSVVIADNSIISLTETLQPRMVATGFSAMGSEAKYKFDMTRYPICVRTWSEFLTAMQLQSEYINIYVSEDITADNTNPTQIDIDPFTLAISISGCEIKDVTNLVLSSLGRDDAFRLDVNNKITLKSTYNPMTLTGDKGSITFNIDKPTTMNVNGEVSSAFVALTNNQTSAVKIVGNIVELYSGGILPTDITGNITISGALSEKADKVAGAIDKSVALLDARGNLTAGNKLSYIDNNCMIIDVCKRVDLSTTGEKFNIAIPAGYVGEIRSDNATFGVMRFSTKGSDTATWTTPAYIQVTTTNATDDSTYTSSTVPISNDDFGQITVSVACKTSVAVDVVTACTGATNPYAIISFQIYCHKE
jgi:hypothetical protein